MFLTVLAIASFNIALCYKNLSQSKAYKAFVTVVIIQILALILIYFYQFKWTYSSSLAEIINTYASKILSILYK